jgi:hypothetical protein
MVDETLGTVRAGSPPQRFDVTHRLSPHNRLEIFVDHPALVEGGLTVAGSDFLPPGGLVGEVRLEIDEGR